ncbi:hypothetical protein F3R91_13675 [Salmonella enterica]|nr:hypothetical protein [Salmonella enterica]
MSIIRFINSTTSACFFGNVISGLFITFSKRLFSALIMDSIICVTLPSDKL